MIKNFDDFTAKKQSRTINESGVNLDLEKASEMLFDKLSHYNELGDRVYELSQSLMDSFVNEINSRYTVVDFDGNPYDGDEEEWFDELREDFFENVYEKLKGYLTKR